MHDGAHAYQSDTVVVEIEEPRRSRVSTVELTMQVLLDGHHHRRTPDLAMTACAKRIPTQYAPIRREELRGKLCDECFTVYELAIAYANNQKENEP